jgi:trimeric autotransporter adhesin
MTKLLRLVIVVFIAVTLHQTAVSQSLSINTSGNPAHPSAILDVESTLKGMLIPRMTKVQKNAIAAPANALLVYQTGPDSVGFHYYDLPNTIWVYINPSAYATDTTAWKITGNSNITAAHFLGTLNDTALRFKIRNIFSGILDSATLNTSLGYKALANRTTAIGNTSLGYLSSQDRTKGDFNTAIGVEVLQRDTAGGMNTAVGWRALRNHVTGSENTAMGVGAMETDSSGFYNTAIGRFALAGQKKGFYNTAVGYIPANTSDSANNVTAIGSFALGYNKRNDNTAVGYAAGYANSFSATGTTQAIENAYLVQALVTGLCITEAEAPFLAETGTQLLVTVPWALPGVILMLPLELQH